MEISLDILAEKLEKYNPELFISYEEFSTIKYLKILIDGQKSFEPGCLYLGISSQLCGFSPRQWPLNLICINNSDEHTEFKENPRLNLVLLNTDSPVHEVFNDIQHIVAQYQQYMRNSAKLLDSLIRGKGLQQILEIGHQLLGNPLLVHDTGFKTVAYTKNVQVDDRFWNEFAIKGYCSQEIFNRLKAGKFIEKVYKSRHPVLEDRGDADHEKIISNIMIGNKIVAHLVVFQYERPFRESDFDQVQLLCDVISSEMQKSNPIYNTKLVIYEHFLVDLLDGKIKDVEVIKEREKYLDLDLKKNIQVAAIDVSRISGKNVSPLSIIDFLGNIIISSNCVLYNDYIVMIVSRNSGAAIQENELAGLEEFLRNNQIFGGYSRSFNTLVDLRKYFNQAVKAIKIGSRVDNKRRLFSYEDYVVYDFMEKYSREELKDFCHPSIFTLVDYDRQNNANYIQSLFESISNEKGKVGSANVLHVHRNTMNYRISKIKEIMNVDLNDKKMVFHIHLSLKILEFIGEVELT